MPKLRTEIMNEDPVEFRQAIHSLEEAYIDGMKGFVSWMKTYWVHETKEKWPHADPWPGEDHARGWNAAIGSLDGALSCFLEEFYY